MKTLFRVEGMRELAKALDDLEPFVAKRISKNALMKMLEPVAAMARSLAPVETPNVNRPRGTHLRDTIGVGTQLTRRQRKLNRPIAKLEVVVGPGVLTKGGRGAARHAHLAEFGTAERHTHRGKSTGTMPRKPFMRPAWDANIGRVFQDTGKMIGVELEAHVKRVASKAARTAAKAK